MIVVCLMAKKTAVLRTNWKQLYGESRDEVHQTRHEMDTSQRAASAHQEMALNLAGEVNKLNLKLKRARLCLLSAAELADKFGQTNTAELYRTQAADL